MSPFLLNHDRGTQTTENKIANLFTVPDGLPLEMVKPSISNACGMAHNKCIFNRLRKMSLSQDFLLASQFSDETMAKVSTINRQNVAKTPNSKNFKYLLKNPLQTGLFADQK